MTNGDYFTRILIQVDWLIIFNWFRKHKTYQNTVRPIIDEAILHEGQRKREQFRNVNNHPARKLTEPDKA